MNQSYKQNSLVIESRAYALLCYLLLEAQKKSTSNTLTHNIEFGKNELEKKNYQAGNFLDNVKNRVRAPFSFLYPKLNNEIQKYKRPEINFRTQSIAKLEKAWEIFAKRYPNDHTVSLGLNTFVDYLQSLFTAEASRPIGLIEQSTIEEFKRKLTSTTWYFFHFDYESDTPLTEITRLLVVFGNLMKPGPNVTVYEKKPKHDFIGEIELTLSTTHITAIINLKRKDTNPKALQIRFSISDGIEDDSLYLGQYIDFEKGETIISGSFVLHQCKYYEKPLVAAKEKPSNLDRTIPPFNLKIVKRKLTYDSGWEYYIPKPIAQYLENKAMNFIKTKTGISNLFELNKFLNKQNKKPFLNSKFNTHIDYDLFLITPVEGLPKADFKSLYVDISKVFFKTPEITAESKDLRLEHCLEASADLQDMGIKRIYYSPRYYFKDIENISEQLDPDDILNQDLVAMRRSRYTMLIMPSAVCSSALIKVGWAIQMEKPIYIFQMKEKALPKLLTKNYKQITQIVLKAMDIKQILSYLKSNRHDFVDN